MDAPMIRTKATIDDWEAYSDHDGFVELIDGEIIVAGGALPEHQDMAFQTSRIIWELRPDGKVYMSPVGVRFDDENMPEPDVFWYAPASTREKVRSYLVGAPDLIIEVLSPSTAKRDKTDKYDLYERYGIREYWLIDPANEFVEVFTLTDGRYQRQGVYEAGQTFVSIVLGVTVDLGAAWAEARR